MSQPPLDLDDREPPRGSDAGILLSIAALAGFLGVFLALIIRGVDMTPFLIGAGIAAAATVLVVAAVRFRGAWTGPRIALTALAAVLAGVLPSAIALGVILLLFAGVAG